MNPLLWFMIQGNLHWILKFNATENDGKNDLLCIRVDQLQHLEVNKHKLHDA